jgi:hypothetical protein
VLVAVDLANRHRIWRLRAKDEMRKLMKWRAMARQGNGDWQWFFYESAALIAERWAPRYCTILPGKGVVDMISFVLNGSR